MEVNVNICMYTQNACMYSSMPQKPFNHEIGTKRLKSYKSHYALAISIKCISLNVDLGLDCYYLSITTLRLIQLNSWYCEMIE